MSEISKLTDRREDLAALQPEWAWSKAVRDTKMIAADSRRPFLVQGLNEPEDDFKKRAELSAYAPITPQIAERIEGAVWRKPPQMNMPDTLSEFSAKVTPTGTDITEFAKDACLEALWGRFAVALVDRPRLVGDVPTNAAEAAAQGLDKPYAVLYTAEQVLDYNPDKLGKLAYIRLDGPTYPRGGQTVREIREVSASGIRVSRIVRSSGGEETLEQDAVIPLAPGLAEAGMLPVAVCNYKRIDAVRGRSPLSGALQAELNSFRLLSDIMFDLWISGHPILLSKTRAALKDIGVGANKYLKLKPTEAAGMEAESITYLEAALPGLAKQMERYASARGEIVEQAGVRPQAQTTGPEAASGVSIAWQFETSEANVLANVADMAADFAWELLGIAALDMGVASADELPTAISVSYSKDFSLQSPERMMASAQAARGLYGAQSSVTKELLRRTALAMLDNITPELEAKIQAEIDASGAYEPPPIPGFEGAGDEGSNEE